MQDNPFISVIMPVYNGERYLREAVQSILSQTYSHFELILIIDGSTDGTENISRSFTDERIVLLKNETNNGLISSLNRGLRQARGELIARMDADDISLPGRFAEQVTVFKNDPEVMITGTDFYHLKGEHTTLIETLNDSDYLKAVLLFATCYAHPTVMMRNPLQKGNIYYEPRFRHVEDYRMWTRMADKGKFYNINTPLLMYRVHAGQVSSLNRDEQLNASSEIRKEYLNFCGFTFSERQLEIHNHIGDNLKVRSVELLKEIDIWLQVLLRQNRIHKKFNELSFNKLIHKIWFDSCGNTSLGPRAFLNYKRSPLASLIRLSSKQTAILLGKCFVRWFRK